VNRAARRRPLPLRLPLVVMSLTRSRHYNRKQSRASRLDQFALLKCATPLKYLMRVHALGLSNSSHARSRQKSEFYYPPLLSNAPPYPSTRQSHQHIVNGQLNLSPEGKGVRLLGRHPAYFFCALPSAIAPSTPDPLLAPFYSAPRSHLTPPLTTQDFKMRIPDPEHVRTMPPNRFRRTERPRDAICL